MSEIRKHYLLDEWVIIAGERGKRPHEFVQPHAGLEPAKHCFFCPGNEASTPPEKGRVGDEKWLMRWFDNKFPAVRPEGDAEYHVDAEYAWSQGFGEHEVIVETPHHDQQLHHLSVERISQLLEVYNNRITTLQQEPGIVYVTAFKNHGKDAGTSLVHSHSQIIALNKVPKRVRDKVAAQRDQECVYCGIIPKEQDSDRCCFENEHAIAFVPYAARFPFELLILPKRHIRTLSDCSEQERLALASCIKQATVKLGKLHAPYNLTLTYAPVGEELHLHIEIIPRLSIRAGFEFLSDMMINTMPPAQAAGFYRGDQ